MLVGRSVPGRGDGELRLPPSLARNDTAYRTLGPAPGEGMIGLGLLDKSGRLQEADDDCFDHYGAIYVLRGSGTYRDSTGFATRFRQGSLFQRLPDRRHSVVFDPGARFAECFFALNIPFAERLMAMGLIDLRRPVVHPGLDLALIDELSRSIAALRRARERDLPRLAWRILDALLDLLTRDRGAAPDDPLGTAIAEACSSLAGRLDERAALAAIVARSGLGYERVRKAFRERMGISPSGYRISRRIERARELLDDGRLTVKAISEKLGYANPYVLSAQFKRLVGLSPQAYRRRGSSPRRPAVRD